MTWTATCVPADTDFAVYEGAPGNYMNHVPVLCSTGGATTATFAPGTGSRYYLVAAHNGWEEGSDGYASIGAERSLSAAACHPQNIASCP